MLRQYPEPAQHLDRELVRSSTRASAARRYAARVAAARERRSLLVWSGYAAFAWGLLFAGISFYWGLGGTLGLDTLGGTLERLGRSGDPAIVAAVWVTGVMKVGGAILALALVQPWGRRLPRLPLLLLGLAAAVVLTLYGGTLVAGEALVASGLVRPGAVDWKPLSGTSTCGTCPSSLRGNSPGLLHGPSDPRRCFGWGREPSRVHGNTRMGDWPASQD